MLFRRFLAVGAFLAPAGALLRQRSGEPSAIPASPCGPSEEDLLVLRAPVPPLTEQLLSGGAGWSGVKFYLHEGGAFNFSDRVQCYFDNLPTDIMMSNMDEVALPSTAEHAVDIWALRRLRGHPGRVYSPKEADLHIIGSEVGASMHASKLKGQPCGSIYDHRRRVDAMLQELKANPQFKKHGGHNWMLINTDWNWQKGLTGEFRELFAAEHMLLATVDLNISSYGAVEPKDTFIVPYKAHNLLEQPDQRYVSLLKTPGYRSYSFMFHGKMGRSGAGTYRSIVPSLLEGLERTSIQDVWMTNKDPFEFSKITAKTAAIMQDTAFCLVPAGDTASSRRLFDSLAAGCVPIILNSFEVAASNLPFPHSIDWRKIAYFAGDPACLANDIEGARRWLESLWLTRDFEDVKLKQKRGRTQFLNVLSYRMGDPVSAMLGEVGLAQAAEAR